MTGFHASGWAWVAAFLVSAALWALLIGLALFIKSVVS